MKTTGDYLRDAQRVLGHTTDGDTMRWLGVSRGSVSRYLAGKSVIDNDAVLWKIAEALEIDVAELMAARAAERAERSGDSDEFRVWAARWRAVSACVVMIFLAMPFAYQNAQADSLYIMLRGRLAKALRFERYWLSQIKHSWGNPCTTSIL